MSNYDPLTLANAFIQAGELDDALDALNQHLEANPEDDEARRLRVQVLMRIGGEKNLHIAFDDQDEFKVPNAEDFAQRSRILEALGDLDAAVNAMARVSDLGGGNSSNLARTINLLLRAGMLKEADLFLEGLVSAPQVRDWLWLTLYGDLAVKQGRDSDAITRYKDALGMLSDHFGSLQNALINNTKSNLLLKRAGAYHRLHLLSEADADYAAAEQIIPNDPMIPFNRGLIALLQGNSERGIDLCRSAYTNAPAALRDEMQKALAEDERYAPITAAIQS